MEVDSYISGCSSGDEARLSRRRTHQKADGRHTSNRWTAEEHTRLLNLVAIHGDSGNWATIAAELPGRTSKQVRQRYINFTRPGTKRAEWTADEEDCIALMHATHGPAWSVICKSLEHRTENAVKNHWHATLRSKNLDQRQGSLLAIYIRMIRDGAPPCIATYEEAKTQLAVQMQAMGQAATLAMPPTLPAQQRAQEQQHVGSAGLPVLAVRAPVMKREASAKPTSSKLTKHDSRSSLLKRTAGMREDSKMSGSMLQNLTLNACNDNIATATSGYAARIAGMLETAAEHSADSSQGSGGSLHPFAVAVTQLQQQQMQQQAPIHVSGSGGTSVQMYGDVIAQHLASQSGMLSGSTTVGLTAAYTSNPGSDQSTGMLYQSVWGNRDAASSVPCSQADAGSTAMLGQEMLHRLQPRNSTEQLEALMHSLQQGDDEPLKAPALLVSRPVAGASQLARLVSDMQSAVSGDTLMQGVVMARARAAAAATRNTLPIKIEGAATGTPLGPEYMMVSGSDSVSVSIPAPVNLQAQQQYFNGTGCTGSMDSVPANAMLNPGMLDSFPSSGRLTSASPPCSSYVGGQGVSPHASGSLMASNSRHFLASPASNVSTPHSVASDLVTVPRSLLMQLGQQQLVMQRQGIPVSDMQRQQQGVSTADFQRLAVQFNSAASGWGMQEQQQQVPRLVDQQPQGRLMDWLHKQNTSFAGQVMLHQNSGQQGTSLQTLLQQPGNSSGLLRQQHNTHTMLNASQSQPLQQHLQAWAAAACMDIETCSTPDLRNLLNSSIF